MAKTKIKFFSGLSALAVTGVGATALIVDNTALSEKTNENATAKDAVKYTGVVFTSAGVLAAFGLGGYFLTKATTSSIDEKIKKAAKFTALFKIHVDKFGPQKAAELFADELKQLVIFQKEMAKKATKSEKEKAEYAELMSFVDNAMIALG